MLAERAEDGIVAERGGLVFRAARRGRLGLLDLDVDRRFLAVDLRGDFFEGVLRVADGIGRELVGEGKGDAVAAFLDGRVLEVWADEGAFLFEGGDEVVAAC